MAIKKTALYSSLWASCDQLRGGMDASQYKDYVLTLLFMKYVSDKYKGDPYGMIVVPNGASFEDMVALKGDKEVGDKLNKIISALAEENDLKGVIDVADFNDEDKLGKGKDMVDRLSKLIGLFEGLDLSANHADGDDLLGDAYEYLMRHFATESGKSKGQFYTPSEVSRILAKVVGITSDTPQDASVYDPTCGSGSLLLKASDEAPRGLSIFGQEMDNATSALSRMNMILHNNATAKIWKGNTLSEPQWKETNGRLKTFDFAVANPPFSNKNWSNGLNPEQDKFNRFTWGVPPEKNGDYAFLLHILTSLKSTGKGAVILPHGVLFRGNAEARIRENLIRQGYIKGIIGLPSNLFYGTGIPACIIVVDKAQAQGRDSIFMVDASKGFIKDGNKNRLRSQDIHKVVDVFTKQTELDRYSRLVPLSEIAANDYNLNIPRYIDASEPEDLHDLSAHLQGGIPNADLDQLSAFWEVFPTLRQTLFSSLHDKGRDGYSQALVEPGQVKSTLLAHPEFTAFRDQALAPFTQWTETQPFEELQEGDKPKVFIHEISEALLEAYIPVPLLSRYDVYQILMDYWAETMQDDVYLITQGGWPAAAQLRVLVPKKGEKLQETPDLIVNKTKYKADAIPPQLIAERFASQQLAEVNAAQGVLDEATAELGSYLEEHGGEDGLLSAAINEKDKITKASVTARLKEIFDYEEEQVLKQAKKLFNAEATAKKAHKEAKEELDKRVLAQYGQLTEEDIQALLIDDKWLASLEIAMQAEIERVTQQLANRLRELEERYHDPLPQLIQQVESLSDKVVGHLRAMGLEY
ncbi:type I restriction-modification system subunit M [Microbulbifer sp. JMSA003]|uniref:type I restriction-modification system subunit M n=1 Tax=Microbulbifer sp. JMSA003 TaxID=3243369 RepID=UPI004039AC87